MQFFGGKNTLSTTNVNADVEADDEYTESGSCQNPKLSVQYQEEGNISYTIEYNHSDQEILLLFYTYDSGNVIQNVVSWHGCTKKAEFKDFVYQTIVHDEQYSPDNYVYITTNFGMKFAKITANELGCFLTQMISTMSNITVEESSILPSPPTGQ